MISLTPQQLRERVFSDLGTLPEDDLKLVAEFVSYLKQRKSASVPHMSATAIRIEAQRRAATLRDVPRNELVARFQQVAEKIRQQAITQGTAIEGDWEGD